jgi:type IV pilus assembly protein PilB
MLGNATTGIIDVLVSENIIDQAKLDTAKNESLARGIPVEQILLEKNWITVVDITKAKSALYGIPFIDIANIKIPENLHNLINEDEAKDSKVIVFESVNGIFKIAMANPLDIQAIRYLEQKLGGRVEVYIAADEDLINKIKNTYSNQVSSQVSSAVEAAVSSSEFVDISNSADDLNSIDVNTAPVAKIVNLVLDSAVDEKASDVHIEPQADHIRIRFRIHGILKESLSLPLAVGPSLTSRIKILAKMPIDEKRKPLDGRFQIKKENQEIDLRISSLPTVEGEKIVIRLLRKDLGILSLEDTGLRGAALKVYTEGLKATAGIILVTGPTGSGKTVTVATSISLLNKPEVNIVSIEDPVEIKIQGVNQVQVNEDAGLTFATALRSFLRQDPNIINVGEIRDEETAGLAAQASLTGHLVISTLHTNSAAGALPRLLDMGVEPYIIASAVNICLAQRLCRRICQTCRYAYAADEAEILEIQKVLGAGADFNLQRYTEYQQKLIQANKISIKAKPVAINNPNPSLKSESTDHSSLIADNSTVELPLENRLYVFSADGCEKCGGSGYNGRIGIFEVFKVTEKLGAMVMQHKSSEEIEREAIAGGMIRMIQDGMLKVIEGTTTIEEVLRVIHT